MKILEYCWDGFRTSKGWHPWWVLFHTFPKFLTARGNITETEARLMVKGVWR